MDDDFPLESRGTTSAFKNLTAEIPKILVSDETADVLRRKARACDMNLTEYCRMLFDIAAFGEDHIANLLAERARQTVRMGCRS